MMAKGLVAAAVMLGGAVTGEAYVPLAQHSLTPPFEDFKAHTGDRELQHWEVGGHASAKRNFLRLTEDRQSKRGWLFNKERLEQKEFGLEIKFRISGTGKHLYGDGLGLWLTKKENNPQFSEGLILGHSDQFTGIGILFDTFRNVEHGHVHKDISLLVNDGREPVALDTDRPGCESHYRYYENRADFHTDNLSVARVWLEKNRLSLEVDKYGKGEFKQCFNVNLADYSLPADWQDNYYLAVSASTGALADNHDVLQITVAEPNKFTHLLKVREEEENAPAVQVDVHAKIGADEVGEHVNDLAFEVSDIGKELSSLQHKFEHDLEKVKMNLEKMLAKLEEKEDGAELRIEELEKARQRQVEHKIESRIEELEDLMHTKIETRLLLLETRLGLKIEETALSGKAWKLPLLAVVLVVVGYMAYTARSLRKLHRRDKLI